MSTRLKTAVALSAALLTLGACTNDASENSDPDRGPSGQLDLKSAEIPADPPSETADGTKYVITVNLTPGIKWSDGTPLTSSDFVGLYNVLWAQQSPLATETLTAVKAPSETQLVFETRELSPNIMQQLIRWNQPAASSQYGEFYDKLAELREGGAKPTDPAVAKVLAELDEMKPDSTVAYGPYVIDPKSVTAQQLKMVKNEEGYNASEIGFDEVDVAWGSTQQTVPLLLQSELDYTTDALTPSDVRAVGANPDIELIRTPLSTGTGVWFNESKAPYDDKRFRQAVAYIIDRDQNAKVALGDAAKPVEYMVGFSDNYVADWIAEDQVAELNRYEQDLEEATALLEEVGLSKDGDQWTYRGEDFGFDITAPSDFPDFLASAKDVSAQLNDFGFDTQVRGIPAANRPDTIAQGRYDVMVDFSMVSTPSHPATSLDWNMASGFFGTNNPEAGPGGSTGLNWPWEQTAPDGTEVYVPDLLEEAVAGLDVEAQKEPVQTLASIFNEELPIVPLFERYTTDPIAHGPRVTGWLPADHPVYKNNQGSDNYVSMQLLSGTLKPADGSDGTFKTSAPYSQPPNFNWNHYGASSLYLSVTSPTYDLSFPPLFWYSQDIQSYVPAVAESYSVAEVE